MFGGNKEMLDAIMALAMFPCLTKFSLILGSQVRHVWRTKLKDRFSSSPEILDEMRCIRCMEHLGHARKITPFAGAQLEICEAFGFEPPKGCDKIYASIRKQKRRRGRPRKKVVEVNND